MISLIHPSRGRPQKAKAAYDYWMSRAANPSQIEHILSLDFSDPLNEMYEIGPDERHRSFGPNSKTIIDHNDCVVEATNSAAKLSKGNILVYLSDDFICPDNWDEKILPYFAGANPVLLRVNDGYQPMENDVLTIPIMNRVLYERIGYFFNPLYKSMWTDVDLFNVCKNFIVNVPELIFEHQHPVTGKCDTDETYARSNANFETGREIYNKRAAEFGWKQAFKKMP